MVRALAGDSTTTTWRVPRPFGPAPRSSDFPRLPAAIGPPPAADPL